MLKLLCKVLFGSSYRKRKSRSVVNSFWSSKKEADGSRGERKVARFLEEYCYDYSAYALNHVTLRLRDGSTTQIDHILITTKGIFVIETKDYSGWIFGNSRSPYWTQIIYKVKNKFQNPIFQNKKHVRAVQNLLYHVIKPHFIHNFVVFAGEAEFKTARPANVLYLEELLYRIRQYPDGIFNLNLIQYCAHRLEQVRLEISQETDDEHHDYLARRFARY